jgi:putative membrane protein
MIDYDPKNWLSIAFRVRGTIAPRLVGRVLIVGVAGTLATVFHTRTGFRIPPIAHTLIGVALGLLLVFRTNASYDRYWEGRKLLGAMVNRTRDLARQAAAFVTDADRSTTAALADITRYLSAFYLLSMQTLRGADDLAPLGALVTEEERTVLATVKARAPVVATRLSRRIEDLARAGVLAPHHVMLMDANVTSLIDYLGGCERIARTPVPFAYAQHIKVFVLLFCLTIPFAIVDVMRGYTPFVAAILAFALMGIDEIGVEIEDPFGDDPNDLPVDRIAETIRVGTGEILR